MMGRLKSEQGQLFYQFQLGDAVPEDHLVRKIDAALDLSWLRSELAPHYSSTGRPSIDPELMIRISSLLVHALGGHTPQDRLADFA
jgi:transposase